MPHFFLDLKLTPGGKLLLSPLLLKQKTPADFQHQSGKVRKEGFVMEKSKVYFTKNITPEAMIQMYEALGLRLPGKVAVKVHSGEMGNQNFIRPEFMQPIIHHVKGTVVECNTAYEWRPMAGPVSFRWISWMRKEKWNFRYRAENSFL